MTEQALGYAATAVFSAMMLPQLAKTLRTRDCRGLSVAMLWLGVLGNCIALAYAYLIQQPPLLVKYSFALCVLLACLAARRRCRT